MPTYEKYIQYAVEYSEIELKSEKASLWMYTKCMLKTNINQCLNDG